MVAVAYPKSSTPGLPGEDQGRLVNCFVEQNGDAFMWKRAAGLDRFSNVGEGVRGLFERSPFLYVAVGEGIKRVSPDGAVTTLGGVLPGAKRVTFARNNRSPSELVLVSEYGAYWIDSTVVRVYPDPNLPLVNSVTFLGGYFLFTTESGVIWASDLNTTTVNPLSFATAEANPDGLLRGVVSGQQFFACGQKTIEVWQNAGTQPFPLSLVHVIPTGLYGPWAIAGFEDGWDQPLIFVASDGTVRQMNGYSPVVISTPAVERSIASVNDRNTVEAAVYTFKGAAFWSVSGPGFTWDYNLRTGGWHERESVGLTRWRAGTISRFGDNWIAADTQGSYLQRLGDYAHEDDQALVWGADSVPAKSFPTRARVASAAFDFQLGTGNVSGSDPQVMISWCLDGANYGNPVQRSLGLQGRYVGPVRVNNLGLATHHGVRLRWRISDEIETSFAGATMEGSNRKP